MVCPLVLALRRPDPEKGNSMTDQMEPTTVRVQRHDNGDVTVQADVRLTREDGFRLLDKLAVAVYGTTQRKPIPGPPNPPPEPRRSYADEHGPLGGYGGES